MVQFVTWRADDCLVGKSVQRFVVILAALVLSVVGAVAPVSAEETTTTTAPPETTTTAPATTAPPTTTGPTTTSPNSESTTSNGESGPTPTNPDGSDVEESTTTDPENPLAEEGPAETVPETDDVIASSGRYSGQGEFETAQVLWSSVREAKAKVAEAKIEHEEAVSRVKSLRLREKELGLQKADLDDETRQTLILLERMETQLRDRALNAFVRGAEAELAANADYDDLLDLQVKNTLIESLLRVDHQAILGYEQLRGSLEINALAMLDRSVLVASLRDDVEIEVDVHQAAINQAERELEAFEAGSAIYIEGVVLPIGDLQYEVPLIDSYGFPRMMGTEDEHWHEGIDIFAPMGAPLVATEFGVITRVGTGKLGGLKVWLHGDSGTDWYYAHLSGFAPGLHEGMVVEPGDVIGYVGTSGNAVGTPPHLHMQVHPGGGKAVNPYPLLFTISNWEIQDDIDEKARIRKEQEDAEAEEAAQNG